MPTDRKINPPCEMCETEVLCCSDPSGGWDECPACDHMQNIRHTPGHGDGRLTLMQEGL